MGKKSKVGKERKDKFYELAKEQGFRARSAFKLTQLGTKMNLFKDVKYVIDLCAAPGGWMQVARQNIPNAGHVWGVDLAPIQPITGCTGIQADITTTRCDRLLEEAMRVEGLTTYKVDLVLCDGAPNVGSSWAKDAYVQNDLVLKALKLATKYLRPGSTFVTKVFRSSDYTKLMWVFEQFFTKCQATKPSSSRNVSAEIFVVCTGYKAPKKIDDAFFDIDKVFDSPDLNIKDELINQALAPATGSAMRMGGLAAAYKTRESKNRSGYAVGDDFRKCTVRQFFEASNAASVLVNHNKIIFTMSEEFDRKIFEHPSTTDAIKVVLADTRLAGKNDLQRVLKWRLKIMQEQRAEAAKERKDEKVSSIVDADKEETTLTVEEQEDKDVSELTELLQKDAKKKLKDLRKYKLKWQAIQRKMKSDEPLMSAALNEGLLFDSLDDVRELINSDVLPENMGEDQDYENFSVGVDPDLVFQNIEKKINEMEDAEDEFDPNADYLTQLEDQLEIVKQMADQSAMLRQAEDKKNLAVKGKRREKMMVAWAAEVEAFSSDVLARNAELLIQKRLDEMDEDDPERLTLIANLEEIQKKRLAEESEEIDIFKLKQQAAEEEETVAPLDGFISSDEEDVFSDDDIKEIDDSELPILPLNDKKLRQIKRKKQQERKAKEAIRDAKKEIKDLQKLGGSVPADLQAASEGISLNQIQTVPVKPVYTSMEKSKLKAITKPEDPMDVAEIQALGAAMIKKGSRLDMMDGMYNRFAFEDNENLPTWFLDDDKTYFEPILPITKETAKEMRDKQKEIDARPIRKVVEAKARKSMRMHNKIQSIKGQIAAIADNPEINDRGKASAIQKLKKKVVQKDDKKRMDKAYVAVNKSGKNTNVSNGKGFTRTVDHRMKSDKRGQKAASKRRR